MKTLEIETHNYTKDDYDYRVYRFDLFGMTMICRESHDNEAGWYNEAYLWGKAVPKMPSNITCEGSNWDSRCSRRRPCTPCIIYEEWADEILAVVKTLTGWGLFRYESGPGRPFAHEPYIGEPLRQSGNRVRVSWRGGLDI